VHRSGYWTDHHARILRFPFNDYLATRYISPPNSQINSALAHSIRFKSGLKIISQELRSSELNCRQKWGFALKPVKPKLEQGNGINQPVERSSYASVSSHILEWLRNFLANKYENGKETLMVKRG